MRMSSLFFGVVLLVGVFGLSMATGTRASAQKTDIEVPYVPTPEKVVEAMLKLAAVKEGDTVYDLGCGDGRIVISAVKDFNAKRGLGIDFNPERLKDCEASMKEAKLTAEQRKRLTFKQGDVLKMNPEDFQNVDVVTLYMLPEVNLKLKPILLKGLRPGSRIVSHFFKFGDWKADKQVTIKDTKDGFDRTIYLWVVPPKK